MYACIDLGSNSFHLLIARWQNGDYEIVERFSEKVQLGEGVASSRQINASAFQRGLRCLDTFRHALARYPVDHCWAVGTNALRIADNADEFLQQAADKGFKIDVVSGLEEAALVYAGVISALPDSDTPRLVIDIGGGSTELVTGLGQQRLQAHSMAIGCISWRDTWFNDIPQQPEELGLLMEKAAQDAFLIFASVSPQLRTTPWQEVYASSGTAKMLSAICAQNLPASAGTGVSLQGLLSLQEKIVRTTLDPKYSLPGLKNGRRDLVLPGWAVLTGFMRACQITELNFSPSALREGMLHYLVQAALKHESPLHELQAH